MEQGNEDGMDKPLDMRGRIARQARIFSIDDRLYSRPASGGGQPVLSDVPLRQAGTGDAETAEAGESGVVLADLIGVEDDPGEIVEIGGKRYLRREAITRAGLAYFQEAYPGEAITKNDVFYYVYGILHSPEYRERWANNLAKELPRIPRVATAAHFWSFTRAGRELGDLHCNYETVEPHPVTVRLACNLDFIASPSPLPDSAFYVTKMRYGKKDGKEDRSVLIINERITLEGIPLKVQEYEVNGKSALDWVIDQQQVKIDKASRIKNDPNDWAIETMGNSRYIIELVCRVITVSLRTIAIVKALPPLTLYRSETHG
jgi:predicted helicase